MSTPTSTSPAGSTTRAGAEGDGAPAAVRGYRLSARHYQWISVLSIVLFLVAWELASRFELVNTLFVSSPSRIAAASVTLAQGELLTHLASSGRLLGIGLGLALVTAIPLGILIGWYRLLAAVLDPFISALYATPRIALIPLIFVWFGIGLQAQVVIVFLVSFFPLIINTMQGMRALDRQVLEMARSFMASDRQLFVTVALPTALPFIVAGIRLSFTLGLIGMVVAEFFTGSTGLGALITRSSMALRTDNAFVGVVIIASVALLFTALLRSLEARVSKWRQVTD